MFKSTIVHSRHSGGIFLFLGNYPGSRISRSFTREGAAISSHRPWRFDSPLGTHTSTKQSAKADCAAGTSPEQSAKADSAAGTSAKQSAKANCAAGTSAKQSAKTECAAGTSAKQSAKADCAAGTFAKQSTKADCATGTSAKQSAKGHKSFRRAKGQSFAPCSGRPGGGGPSGGAQGWPGREKARQHRRGV